MKLQKSNFMKNKAEGFSLLEILIAIIILSIGMLGLAALQAASLKTNHGAYHKTQATYLAYDMVDRLRANKQAAMNGNYNILEAAAKPAADGTLPNDDLNDWITSIEGALPTGDGEVVCNNPNLGVCSIVVSWNVQREGGTAVDSNANIQRFTFVTEL